MDKQDFYLQLTLELNKLNVPPQLINTHIEQFKSYLEMLPEEEVENQINSFGDIKDLAANIYKLLCGDDNNTPSITNETVFDSFKVDDDEDTNNSISLDIGSKSEKIDSFFDDLISDLEKPAEYDQDTDNEINEEVLSNEKVNSENHDNNDENDDTSAEAVNDNPEQINEYTDESDQPLDLDFDLDNDEDYIEPDFEFETSDADTYEVKDNTKVENIDQDDEEEPEQILDADIVPVKPAKEEIDLNDIYDEETFNFGKGSVIFWIIFILTLPITLPLFILCMAFFGFLYIVLSLIIAAIFISMIACVVIGSGLALSAIMYGAIQMRAANIYIGLYEIGLGIALIGITILATVILYHLSVKLLPRLYKYITKILRLFLVFVSHMINKLQKVTSKK